jgi:hypothetical protein
MRKNKTTAIAISVLIAAMAISLFPLYTVVAQSDGERATHAYIGATPNPVGVGQETLLHVGIMQQLSLVQQGWEGLTVTVKKPDGTTQTLGPFRTDSTGGTGHVFVPQEEGEYILQTHFPQQVTTADNLSPGSPAGTIMLASQSPELTLVVQAEPILIYQEHPLPTEYWTRPIDSQLRGWAPVAGSWLESPENGKATGNEAAPETAHILWKHPLVLGGLSGGDLGDAGAYTGDAYEGKFQNSLIIQGILIYRKFDTIGGTSVDNWHVAVDLHTGEKLWEKEFFAYDDPTDQRIYPTFGQIFYWDSFNSHGTHTYLICSSSQGGFFSSAPSAWHAFDPLTGRWLWTWENVPAGTRNVGPHGEIIIYSVSLSAGTMRMWNSSAVIDAYWGTSPNSPNWGSWRPQGKITDATGECPVTPATPLGLNGYQWEVSIPTGLTGSIVDYAIDDKIVGYSTVAQSSYFGGTMGVSKINTWGISLKPGSQGNLLFNEVYNTPSSWANGNVSVSLTATSIEDGLMTFWAKELTHSIGISTNTGKYLWGPTDSQNYLDYLGHRTYVAYGMFISQGMSGIVYCYNATTGDLMWTYEADDPYNQVLWANQWHIRPLFFAGGKLYMGTTEHSPVDPLTRGGPFVAIDLETGEEVFRADGLFRQTDWGGRAVIGDSIIATMDTYDLQVYGIGKGPSAITAEIEDDVVTYGDGVLVKGMVTDVSPGTKEYAVAARFPNGVPAVSDDDMSEWMLYVHKQFERPADVVGVDVVVEVFDPNGNYYEVGTTTSDSSGKYSLYFNPIVPGKYTVFVTFAGSKAYYNSWDETDLMVEEAPEATPGPTPTPAPMTDAYVLGLGAGSIIAIVAIGLLLVLMLRKR